MALMLGALYKALIEPNEENARRAAEEVVENRFAKIDADLRFVQWMVGTNVVLTIGVLWMLFTIMGRLR